MGNKIKRIWITIISLLSIVLLSFMAKIVVSALEPGIKAPCVRIINGKQEVALTYEKLFTASTIPIIDYLGDVSLHKPATALAYYRDGSQGEISLNGFLEWQGNFADYVGPDGKCRKEDIIGIWVDPPKLSVTHVAGEVLSALENQRVLTILLDGLSYYDLEKVRPSFLSTKNILPARTVMPSITPVSLAAILTGKLPNETGITARNMRQLKVDDIFVAISKMGKSSAMVGASTKVINTSIEQLLNPDLNGNGSTDDEVFASARDQLDQGIDFVFVHFHGYDDLAHTYGPLSDETIDKMIELDSYVEELCLDFSGMVLVIADHGQHRTEGNKLGDHGEFRLLDMTIPWIQWENEGVKP